MDDVDGTMGIEGQVSPHQMRRVGDEFGALELPYTEQVQRYDTTADTTSSLLYPRALAFALRKRGEQYHQISSTSFVFVFFIFSSR